MYKSKNQIQEERRIFFAIKNKVQHFSPTISPAPKDVETGEIESVGKALEIFKETGCEYVVLQPKYMGSYCDIEIHRDISQSRFFSRKGHMIRNNVDRAELLQAIQHLHFNVFFHNPNISKILISAELMPWSTLGKGLIERDFNSYHQCVSSHVDYLKETNLLDRIKILKDQDIVQQFLSDQETMTKKEIQNKYPNHYNRRTYRALDTAPMVDLDWISNGIKIYEEQLELYGQQGPVTVKPFAILKYYFEDGTEKVQEYNTDNLKEFGIMNEFITIDLTDMVKAKQEAYDYYNSVVGNNTTEGIMIKSDKVWIKDHVPALKVRNPNYLHLIYGVNFGVDFDYYLERRKVGRKMKISANEWNISQTMLRIPETELIEENEDYIKLIHAHIKEEWYESQLDTRL